MAGGEKGGRTGGKRGRWTRGTTGAIHVNGGRRIDPLFVCFQSGSSVPGPRSPPSNVNHSKVDCYSAWSSDSVGRFDVMVTYPPYSEGHVERMMEKSWFLLIPQYVHKHEDDQVRLEGGRGRGRGGWNDWDFTRFFRLLSVNGKRGRGAH